MNQEEIETGVEHLEDNSVESDMHDLEVEKNNKINKDTENKDKTPIENPTSVPAERTKLWKKDDKTVAETTCNICKKVFITEEWMKRHRQTQIEHKKEKPIIKELKVDKEIKVDPVKPKCDVCGKTFITEEWMKRHRK